MTCCDLLPSSVRCHYWHVDLVGKEPQSGGSFGWFGVRWLLPVFLGLNLVIRIVRLQILRLLGILHHRFCHSCCDRLGSEGPHLSAHAPSAMLIHRNTEQANVLWAPPMGACRLENEYKINLPGWMARWESAFISCTDIIFVLNKFVCF